MRIAIIGPGRLGRTLEKLLTQFGHSVVMLGRKDPVLSADLYWLCVPDRSISSVASTLPSSLPKIHSAGSLGPEILGDEGAVLHPLMTFPGIEQGIPDLRGVIATLSGKGEALRMAENLGKELGMQVIAFDGDRRRYHAAATMASSHVASAFLLAAKVLERGGFGEREAREALLPLAVESLKRAVAGAQVLTGPTVRGDGETESAHVLALEEEELQTYGEGRRRILKLLGRSAD